jgi:RNA polymerase sigma-70 factor, ECF subfamily
MVPQVRVRSLDANLGFVTRWDKKNQEIHFRTTVIEAAQRDPTRFAELYEANFDRVYTFVARRLPSRQEADDVTAEVFHQALAGIANFEWQGTPFLAWLLGIASHLIAHRWQRHAKYPEIPADDLEEPGVLDQTERQAWLAQLVDRLPDDQRHVIRRRFIDQHSIREIAHELGRSEGAIKQLQFRAIENLRDQMRSHHA